MTRSRISIGVIAVTLLTVATLFLLPLPRRAMVQTAEITRGEIMETLLLEGMVSYEGEEMLVSLEAGQIEQVFVNRGEQVQKGQLLFSLNTAEEEMAMSRLTSELGRLEALEDNAAVYELITGQRLELYAEQAMLRKSIALKQVRAQRDGVMGVVCCRAGEYVLEGTVLGSMHGESQCVMAFARSEAAQGLENGAAAWLLDDRGKRLGTAVLQRIGAPCADGRTGAAGHPLWFSLTEELPLGQRVTVELILRRWKDQTLVPIEAMTSEGCVWVVDNGVARPVMVDVIRQDGEYASIDAEMEGVRVILRPEEIRLSPGRAVREGSS